MLVRKIKEAQGKGNLEQALGVGVFAVLGGVGRRVTACGYVQKGRPGCENLQAQRPRCGQGPARRPVHLEQGESQGQGQGGDGVRDVTGGQRGQRCC